VRRKIHPQKKLYPQVRFLIATAVTPVSQPREMGDENRIQSKRQQNISQS
jgi:hypothetical protein